MAENNKLQQDTGKGADRLAGALANVLTQEAQRQQAMQAMQQQQAMIEAQRAFEMNKQQMQQDFMTLVETQKQAFEKRIFDEQLSERRKQQVLDQQNKDRDFNLKEKEITLLQQRNAAEKARLEQAKKAASYQFMEGVLARMGQMLTPELQTMNPELYKQISGYTSGILDMIGSEFGIGVRNSFAKTLPNYQPDTNRGMIGDAAIETANQQASIENFLKEQVRGGGKKNNTKNTNNNEPSFFDLKDSDKFKLAKLRDFISGGGVAPDASLIKTDKAKFEQQLLDYNQALLTNTPTVPTSIFGIPFAPAGFAPLRQTGALAAGEGMAALPVGRGAIGAGETINALPGMGRSLNAPAPFVRGTMLPGGANPAALPPPSPGIPMMPPGIPMPPAGGMPNYNLQALPQGSVSFDVELLKELIRASAKQ